MFRVCGCAVQSFTGVCVRAVACHVCLRCACGRLFYRVFLVHGCCVPTWCVRLRTCGVCFEILKIYVTT